MPPAPQGPIAYCAVEIRVHESDNSAWISVIGCVMNSNGTLVLLGPEGVPQFDALVPVAYGMGASELTTAVKNALSSGWGVTGLADVKFIPSF